MSASKNFTLLLSVILLSFVTALQSQVTQVNTEKHQKMHNHVTTMSKLFIECAREVGATVEDIKEYIHHLPQTNREGKCLVACTYNKTPFFKNQKIDEFYILEENRQLYNKDNEVMSRLRDALNTCLELAETFEDHCDYAATFHICFEEKREHILENVSEDDIEDAMPHAVWDHDEWHKYKEQLLNNVKDEL